MPLTDDMLSALVVGREEPIFPKGFGKYELLERVGAGGMAEVFRAVVRGAEGFEKEVCIKRILPMFTEDEDFVRMFIDEAALASKLHHANIVQTLDFDKIDGQYYIALEFVEGRDLKRVLTAVRQSGRPMPLGVGAFIGAEILKGLHFAHARRHSGQALGVIHRDISPHNVLVSMSGEVKITDFGIAKAASRASATRSGVVKGKILYMSPEQATGAAIDHRADLFSAGVVLYETLTGARPFAADTDVESLAKIAKGTFAPPRTVRPELPERLEAVVCKLLARQPGDRYATGADALRDPGPEVPADGAMQLAELMTGIVEGPVAISRRTATEILDIEKPRPPSFDAPVVPAASGAVTRTRGPREEPEAIAFLDTQIAAQTRPGEAASLGSEFLPSVPTQVSGPPEDMPARDSVLIPPTAVHSDLPVPPTDPGPRASVTAPETPGARGRTPAASVGPSTPDATPAAWSFSAEAPGSDMRVRRRGHGPALALGAALLALAGAVGFWATRPRGSDLDALAPPSAMPPPALSAGSPAAPGAPMGRGLFASAPPAPRVSEPAPAAAGASQVPPPPAVSGAPSAPPQPSPSPAAGAPLRPASQTGRGGRGGRVDPSAVTPAVPHARRTERAVAPPAPLGEAAARTPPREASPRTPPREAASPAAPPAAEPQGFGTLVINAQPWARVRINGRPAGDTPVGPVRVPAGTVRIVLERDGRSPLTRTLTLAPGEERSLSVPFP